MEEIKYFAIIGKTKKGPYSRDEIKELYSNLIINSKTLIAPEGSNRWISYKNLKDFKVILPPPPPGIQNPTKNSKPSHSFNKNKSNNESFTPPGVHSEIENTRTLNLMALPIALLITLLMKFTFLKWVMWISSMWVHELGHSVTGWLASRFMFPVPFLATFGNPIFNALFLFCSLVIILIGFQYQNKYISWIGVWLIPFFASYYFHSKTLLLFALFFFLFAFLVYMGNSTKSKLLVFLGITLIILQIYFTFILDEKKWDMVMRFSGIGGEFLIGSFLVVLFYYKLPEVMRWDFFRFIFLLIGMYSLVSASIDWHSYASNHSLMPFGTALSGSSDPHGDLNFLRDKYMWTESLIANRYLLLSRVCIVTVVLHYFYFIFASTKSKKSNII